MISSSKQRESKWKVPCVIGGAISPHFVPLPFQGLGRGERPGAEERRRRSDKAMVRHDGKAPQRRMGNDEGALASASRGPQETFRGGAGQANETYSTQANVLCDTIKLLIETGQGDLPQCKTLLDQLVKHASTKPNTDPTTPPFTKKKT